MAENEQKKDKKRRSGSPAPKASPKGSKKGKMVLKPAPKVAKKSQVGGTRPPHFEESERDPVPALPELAWRPEEQDEQAPTMQASDASGQDTERVKGKRPHVESFPRLPIGTTVVRNPACWMWKDQDGGPGSTGTVIADNPSKGEVKVQWEHGGKNHYRYGLHSAQDVGPASEFNGFTAVPGIKQLADSTPEIEGHIVSDLSRCFDHPLRHITVEVGTERKVNSEGDEEGIKFTLVNVDTAHVKNVLHRGVELPWLTVALREAKEKTSAYTAGGPPGVPVITPPSPSDSPIGLHDSRFAVPPGYPSAQAQQVPPPASSPSLHDSTPRSLVAPFMPVFAGQNVAAPLAPAPSSPSPSFAALVPLPAQPQHHQPPPPSSVPLVTKVDVMCTIQGQGTRLLKLTLKGDTNGMPMLAIKRSLEAYTSVPIENQLLEKDGAVLDDYLTGLEVGIRPGLTLFMRLKDPLVHQSTSVPNSQRTFILTESALQAPAASLHLPLDRSPAVSVSPVPYPLYSRGVSPPRR